MKSIYLFVLFILVHSVLIFPGSAAINKIPAGGEIFIGESGLDITPGIGDSTHIAWWYSSSDSEYDQPDDIQTITNPKSFFVDPDIYLGKEGKWFQWNNNAKGPLALFIRDPELDIKIWDGTLKKDITNGEIPIGNILNFAIKTNMRSIIYRPGYQPNDALYRIKILGGDGTRYYDYLIGKEGKEHKLMNLPVNQESWFWISPPGKQDTPALDDGWNTGALDNSGKLFYKPGFYTVWVECDANNLKNNYKAPDGSDYTGKTVSYIKSIKLLPSSDENSEEIFNFEESESSNSDYSVEDLYYKGLGLSNDGKHDEAIEYYNKAIELDPVNAGKSWEGLGRSYYQMGKLDEAIENYKKAIDLDPLDAADSWSQIGRIYSDLKNYEESVKAYANALELRPNDYYDLIFIAYSLEELHRYEDAIVMREKALTVPTDISDFEQLANDYIKIGEYQKAIDTYNRALVIDPRDASMWGHIGETYEMMGEYQKAIDIFNECQTKNLRSCSLYCVPSMQETEDFQNL